MINREIKSILSKLYMFPIAFILLLLTSCEVVGGIFKAGYYVGIFVVVGIILLIFGVIAFFKRKN